MRLMLLRWSESVCRRRRRVGRAAGWGQPWPFGLVFDGALWMLFLFLRRCAARESTVIPGGVVVSVRVDLLEVVTKKSLLAAGKGT